MGKTYKTNKSGKSMRRPRNRGERKSNADAKDQGVKVRGKRSNRKLQSDYDDKSVGGSDTYKGENQSSKKKPNVKGAKSIRESKLSVKQFIMAVVEKNYADADKYLNDTLTAKLQKRMMAEQDKPIF